MNWSKCEVIVYSVEIGTIENYTVRDQYVSDAQDQQIVTLTGSRYSTALMIMLAYMSEDHNSFPL